MSEIQPTTPTTAAAVRMAPAGWYDEPGEPGTLRYWNGNAWTPNRAPKYKAVAAVPTNTVVVTPPIRFRKTSHGFHLIMTILTLGLWAPVWIIMTIYNAAKSD